MIADILHHPAFGKPRVKNRKTRGWQKGTVSFEMLRLRKLEANLAADAAEKTKARDLDLLYFQAYSDYVLSGLRQDWQSYSRPQILALAILANRLQRRTAGPEPRRLSRSVLQRGRLLAGRPASSMRSTYFCVAGSRSDVTMFKATLQVLEHA